MVWYRDVYKTHKYCSKCGIWLDIVHTRCPECGSMLRTRNYRTNSRNRRRFPTVDGLARSWAK